MNLLVTGAWKCSEEQLNRIRQMGHNVIFQQMESEDLVCEYDTIDGVICNGLFLYHPIERFANLKYIQLTSAGLDRVPMKYVKEHEIKIKSARGVYSIPMAEFAISGVLQLYKQSRFFFQNQEKHKWDKHRGLIEIAKKTVAIVGCGSVGNECAKRFRAFSCEIIGVDIHPIKNQIYDKVFFIGDIYKVLELSDIVVLTLPLTEETKYMFNADAFGHMKEGSVFVNIARGAIVNQESLKVALKNHLEGAVIDVFEEEPLSEDDELWEMENVILTPHNSFVGDGNSRRLEEVIIKNLEQLQ